MRIVALPCLIFVLGCAPQGAAQLETQPIPAAVQQPPPEAISQFATDGPTPKIDKVRETQEIAAPTKVLDRDDLARLMGNSGITLQWIDWEKRGQMKAGNRDGVIWLSGTQFGDQGKSGALYLQGRVVEIGTNYFTMSGEITIEDTPDHGRNCNMQRNDWRFEVTQNRKYWRLRQFEWCDGLTDYIDIYF